MVIFKSGRLRGVVTYERWSLGEGDGILMIFDTFLTTFRRLPLQMTN